MSGQGQAEPDLVKLDEATAFERLALQSVTPLTEPLYIWVDLRGQGSVGVNVQPAHEGAASAEAVREQIRPLVWGAAWKILDLVIEYALPPRGRWLISEKVKRARSQRELAVWPPFNKDDADWKAALLLYANSKELRHSLVHRREDLREKLTPDEQTAFCWATRRLINAILTGEIEPRDRDDLALHLARVSQLSKVPATSKGPLGVLCEIHIELRDDGSGGLELDAARLDEAMRGQPQCQAFDVVAYLPGARPLIGKLEDAPLDYPVTRFPRSAPPEWLSDKRERRTLRN